MTTYLITIEIFSAIAALAGIAFFFLKSESKFPMKLIGTCFVFAGTCLPLMFFLEPSNALALICLCLWLGSLFLLTILIVAQVVMVVRGKEKPLTLLLGSIGFLSISCAATCVKS